MTMVKRILSFHTVYLFMYGISMYINSIMIYNMYICICTYQIYIKSRTCTTAISRKGFSMPRSEATIATAPPPEGSRRLRRNPLMDGMVDLRPGRNFQESNSQAIEEHIIDTLDVYKKKCVYVSEYICIHVRIYIYIMYAYNVCIYAWNDRWYIHNSTYHKGQYVKWQHVAVFIIKRYLVNGRVYSLDFGVNVIKIISFHHKSHASW